MNPFNDEEWQQHLLRIQALRSKDRSDIFYLGPDKWKSYRGDAHRDQQLPRLEQPQEMRNQLAAAADLHSKVPSQIGQIGNVVGTGIAWVIFAVIISLILLAVAPVLVGGLALAIALVPGPIIIGAIAFWMICWSANSLVRSGVRDELERQERNRRREELKKIQL